MFCRRIRCILAILRRGVRCITKQVYWLCTVHVVRIDEDSILLQFQYFIWTRTPKLQLVVNGCCYATGSVCDGFQRHFSLKTYWLMTNLGLDGYAASYFCLYCASSSRDRMSICHHSSLILR